MEIWGNEGWNAYHADAAMRGAAQLYPPTDGLIANNYPPLSYYLMGWLGRLFGDPLYVGRALSILSTLGIGAAAAAVVRQFGGSRAGALLAGFWLVATLARFFEFYVGMNEPQLFGLAVMSAGFAWFWKRHADGRAVEPAVLRDGARGLHQAQLHHAAAGRACSGSWLDNWRLGLRATLVGARRIRARACDLRLHVRALFHSRHAVPAHLSSGARAFDARPPAIHPARDGAVGDLGLARARAAKAARFTALLIGIALPLCLAAEIRRRASTKTRSSS